MAVHEGLAASVLAETEISAGVVGFFVVLALIAASIVIFFFMSKSLRRMRANLANGEFAGVDPQAPKDRRGRRPAARVIDGEVIGDEVIGGTGAPGPAADAAASGAHRVELPAQPGPPADSPESR